MTIKSAIQKSKIHISSDLFKSNNVFFAAIDKKCNFLDEKKKVIIANIIAATVNLSFQNRHEDQDSEALEVESLADKYAENLAGFLMANPEMNESSEYFELATNAILQDQETMQIEYQLKKEITDYAIDYYARMHKKNQIRPLKKQKNKDYLAFLRAFLGDNFIVVLDKKTIGLFSSLFQLRLFSAIRSLLRKLLAVNVSIQNKNQDNFKTENKRSDRIITYLTISGGILGALLGEFSMPIILSYAISGSIVGKYLTSIELPSSDVEDKKSWGRISKNLINNYDKIFGGIVGAGVAIWAAPLLGTIGAIAAPLLTLLGGILGKNLGPRIFDVLTKGDNNLLKEDVIAPNLKREEAAQGKQSNKLSKEIIIEASKIAPNVEISLESQQRDLSQNYDLNNSRPRKR